MSQALNLVRLRRTADPLLSRSFHQSACCSKNIRAGKPKISTRKGRKTLLNYEEAFPPEFIGVTKGWSSWNTSNLVGERDRAPKTTLEDMIIRQFITGLWPERMVSEIIIKRRHNMIIIAFIIEMRYTQVEQVYFMQGFSEELLSHFLHRPVKIEMSTVEKKLSRTFKII